MSGSGASPGSMGSSIVWPRFIERWFIERWFILWFIERWGSARRDRTDLLHEPHLIPVAPPFDDLPIRDPRDVGRSYLDPIPGRWDPHEFAGVRGPPGHPIRHQVARGARSLRRRLGRRGGPLSSHRGPAGSREDGGPRTGTELTEDGAQEVPERLEGLWGVEVVDDLEVGGVTVRDVVAASLRLAASASSRRSRARL